MGSAVHDRGDAAGGWVGFAGHFNSTAIRAEEDLLHFTF